MLKRFLRDTDPELRVMSVGRSIEMLKADQRPTDVLTTEVLRELCGLYATICLSKPTARDAAHIYFSIPDFIKLTKEQEEELRSATGLPSSRAGLVEEKKMM